MEINMNHEAKIVEVWLTQAEQQSLPQIRQSLSPMLQSAKKQKYLPVFYISGTQPLYPATSDLLKHNFASN